MKDVKARFHRFSHPDLMEKVKLEGVCIVCDRLSGAPWAVTVTFT